MSSEFMSHMGDLLTISPKLEPTVSKDCGLSLTNRHIWSCFSKKTGVSTLFFGLGTGPGAAGRLAFVWRNIKVRLNRLLSLSLPLSKQLCWKWLNLTRAAFFWQWHQEISETRQKGLHWLKQSWRVSSQGRGFLHPPQLACPQAGTTVPQQQQQQSIWRGSFLTNATTCHSTIRA